MTTAPKLSARERQIMDVIYGRGEATVAEVRRELPDPPSYSAVRGLLRILEEKGHLRHRAEGRRYVYLPVVPRRRAQRSAMQRVLKTFFGGSAPEAVAALLEMEARHLSEADLDELVRLVERARDEGR